MKVYKYLAGWYDELTGDVPYREFADYYERFFAGRGKPVRTVLDLACGTGNMTCLLAKRGYETIAVDASEEMLALAAEKAVSLEGCTPPMFFCQALSELDLYGTVDAAVCCLDGMNYLPPDELPEVFRRLSLFIEPAGMFVFDIHAPERLRLLDGQVFVDEKEDLLCLWRADFDEGENALIYGLDIFAREGRRWRRESEEHVEYAHDPEMLKTLLFDAGFGDVRILFNGPQSDSGRVFVTAINKRGAKKEQS